MTEIDGEKLAAVRRRLCDFRPRQRRRLGRGPLCGARHAADLGRTTSRGWRSRRSPSPRRRAPPDDGLHHARSGRARPTWSPPPRSRTSTGCRCCCSPATSSPPARPIRCCSSSRPSATAPPPSTTASVRCRAISTASSGLEQISRRSTAPSPCSPTRPNAARSRSPSARTCKPRPTIIRRRCSRRASIASAGQGPDAGELADAVARSGREEAAGRLRRRRALFVGRARAPAFCDNAVFPSPRRRRASRRRRATIRCTSARSASPARTPPIGSAAEADVCSRRHAARRLHHRLVGAVQEPRPPFDRPQCAAVRRRQASRAAVVARRQARPRRADAALGDWRAPAPMADGGAHGEANGLRPPRATPLRPTRWRRPTPKCSAPSARAAKERRGRLRRRRPAGRTAQAVAGGRAARLSPRIRLFLHGLRDRRRLGVKMAHAGPRDDRRARRRLLSDDEFGDRDFGDARAPS